MYAVMNTGGKQYKVSQGDTLRVEKLPGDVGSAVTFDKVLLFSDGQTLQIGKPYVDDLTVNGQIVEQNKEKKIIVFKFKKRKRYKRKQGHRQPFTAVRIDDMLLAGKTVLPTTVGGSLSEAEAAAQTDVIVATDEPGDLQPADQTEARGE